MEGTGSGAKPNAVGVSMLNLCLLSDTLPMMQSTSDAGLIQNVAKIVRVLLSLQRKETPRSITAVLTKQSLFKPLHSVIGSSDLYMCAEDPSRIMSFSEMKSPATALVSNNAIDTCQMIAEDHRGRSRPRGLATRRRIWELSNN